MVKTILKEQFIEIPEGVKINIKAKVVTVEVPLGKISRSFCKVPIQIREVKDEKDGKLKISVRIWFSKCKEKSYVISISRHINNMILGVTKGYKYTMMFGSKHFPIHPIALKDGKLLQVSNFMGQKYTRKFEAIGDTKIEIPDKPNNKVIYLKGIDKELLGRVGATIKKSCKSRNLDKRVFKDGILFAAKEVNE